ncbi:hypothetical protein M5689_012380 [Euphorbia peplus]|nr:hypothetical protein M5689_012380 [Euphorbia peplus]
MSDLTVKSSQNKQLTVTTQGSVEVHDDDSSPTQDDEHEEPPRSFVHNKETTRNLENAFEEEDREEEPTASDIFRMVRSMQQAQEQQIAQYHILVSHHLAMKEENKSIMRLIQERLLKPYGDPLENLSDGEQPEELVAGRFASLPPSTPRRSVHNVMSPQQTTPRSEADLEIQFERWMEKRSIG